MTTVNRVLPWRRELLPSADEIQPLLGRFQGRSARPKADLILRAYELAAAAHVGQSRQSGEGYIHHPVKVAEIIAGLGLDEVTIAAALLHDVVEDTEITLDQIEQQFSTDVALIVDGVTKLDRINFDSKEAQQAASMRKMFIAITKDLRVLIIKLADRLHNMRTISSMPVAKQCRIATETRDVYAPLAHRLGMEDMKVQLEDLSFAALHPKWYAQIDHMVSLRAPERDIYLTQVVEHVRQLLQEVKIEAVVTGRPKHLWSIYEKMVVKNREFDEIYDLLGLRVVVDSVKDCYAALGTAHASWKPVQGRFKDFIAMPKFNNYQSLHTTVIGPQGKPIELQIRTHEMHVRAEYGVAAHWRYKSDVGGDFEWLNRIVDWQSETVDPAEFMTNLRTDLDQEEVVVFSPKGKVVSLPIGATPIDFAYTIHTEIGRCCVGTKVNGALVGLDAQLQSGDTVEIVTSRASDAAPSRDWLDFAVTPKARNKIRQQLSRDERKDAVDAGAEEVRRLLQSEGLPSAALRTSEVVHEVAAGMGLADADALFLAVGEGRVGATTAAKHIGELLRHHRIQGVEQLATTARDPRSTSREQSGVGIHAEGLDDVVIRLATCCAPTPAHEIIGFETRGQGVAVHRADCEIAVSFSARNVRLVDVEWDEEISAGFIVSITVSALDRPRLLRDVTAALADHQLNITHSSTTTGKDRGCIMRFEVEMGDGSHLGSVLSMIGNIEGVYTVERRLH